MKTPAIILAISVAGCATPPAPPPASIAPPSPVLLAPAKPIADLPSPATLPVLQRAYGQLRIDYANEIALRRGLIAYVRALRG